MLPFLTLWPGAIGFRPTVLPPDSDDTGAVRSILGSVVDTGQGPQLARERHGGLNGALKKIIQWEQETLSSNGRGMIDDFRLRGGKAVESDQRATEQAPGAHMGGA